MQMKYNKENPLKVFEAFGGYGSQSLSLCRLKEHYPDFDFKVVGYSDIEEAAIKAYMALHNGENVVNYGDICKINYDEVPDFDLFTYSFPCTDISAAGLQLGLKRDSNTRSSLLWECERAIEKKRPKYLLMENVAALVSQKFIKDFHEWLRILEKYGYESFTHVLDASQYGVPQHRERVFCVSILRTEEEPIPKYHFPKPFKLEKCLADVLEDDVDESYFLSDEMLARFCEKSVSEDYPAFAITSDEYAEDFEKFFVQGSPYNTAAGGVCYTLNTRYEDAAVGDYTCPRHCKTCVMYVYESE